MTTESEKMPMKKRISVWGRLKAYKLRVQFWIALLMFLLFVLSMAAYQVPAFRENEVISNILLALFTSLLVTVFTMAAEIVVSYHEHRNDQYLEDIYQFGIATFHRDKETALRELLSDCDKTIWISGYRLILTRQLRPDIAAAIRRGAHVTAVICPPWSQGFRLVYGDNEKVLDNYLACFETINAARLERGGAEKDFRVVFVDKPLFSDTYRIDQNIVTGPYMHNTDPEFKRMMAKDFFCYNIVRRSDLYEIVTGEFQTLLHDAKTMLNWERFAEICRKIDEGDYCEAEKIEMFRSACDPIPEGTEIEAAD